MTCEWKPFDTAPKRNGVILAAHDDWASPQLIKWSRAMGRWYFFEDVTTVHRPEKLTHWFPWPEMPGEDK